MGLIIAIVAVAVLVGAILVERMGMVSHKTGFQLIASALIVVPIVLLMTLAIGELAGGDVSGAQHVVTAIPLFLVLAGAWRYPRATAIVLIIFGLIMLLVSSLGVATSEVRRDELWVLIFVVLVLVVAPLAAGCLLWRAQATPPRAT